MNGSTITTVFVIATAVLGILTFGVPQVTKGAVAFPLWPSFVCGAATLLWVCISLPIAATRVVHRERLSLIDVKDELANERAQNSRDLGGEIVSFHAGGTSPDMPGMTMAVVEAIVRNLSPRVATTAEDYTVTLTREGEQRLYRPGHIPGSITLMGTQGQQIKFDASEFLYNKTAPDPIPAGGFRAGRLFFPIPESDRKFLEEGVKAVLEFVDVKKKRYATPAWQLNFQGSPGLAYIPGTHTLIQQPGPSTKPLRPGERNA